MHSALTDAIDFHDFRADAELIGYEPISLPYFLLWVEAIVQERKPVPVIEEYTLRSVSEGLTSPEEIAGFLGLESRIADEAVVRQLQSTNVSYMPTALGSRELQMTRRGHQVLGELATYEPESIETTVAYDRMLGRVVGSQVRGGFRPADNPFRPLRARPPVRVPRLRDLNFEEVRTTLSSAVRDSAPGKSTRVDRELIGLRRVTRSERRYKPATLLFFSRGSRVYASIAADGEASREYTQAITDLGGLEYLDTPEASLKSPAGLTRAESQIPPSAAMITEDVDERAAASSFVRAWRRLADPDIAQSETEASAVLSRQSAESAYIESGRRLLKWKARRVRVWEHAVLLNWAVVVAERTLLVRSNNATELAVDQSLVRSLEDAANRGCRVYLIVGPQHEKESPAERGARRRLAELGNRERITYAVRDSAGSALVWDGGVVYGSFPWLSHLGDPDEPKLTHQSIAINDSGAAQRQLTAWLEELELD